MKRIWCFAVILTLFMINATPMELIAGAQLHGWSQDIRLTFSDSRSLTPSIAVEGKNVYIVYADGEGGGEDDRFLWYTNSSDGGDTWISPICIVNNSPRKIFGPKIAVNGDYIHVIWLDSIDERVHYIRSVDNGNSWTINITLTDNVDRNWHNWNIGLNQNNIHIVYIDSNYKLSYVHSNNNGLTWSVPKILIPTYSRALDSDIAINGSNVHIAWYDMDRGGKFTTEIFYIKSEDNGLTWEEDINITNTPVNQNVYVDIAVNKDSIYIVYCHKETKRQVYFSYSEDNGDTWVRNIKLSNSTENTFRPKITVQSDNVFVFWDDFRGFPDVFYKYSSDNGKIWSPDIRLIYGYGPSIAPNVASTEDTVHLVWKDERDGNEEIYYKRYMVSEQPVKAIIDINPDTLNLKSKGRWITAYIELTEGNDVNDINTSSILLENVVPAEDRPTKIGDYDNDNISDLMVKFDRSEVIDLLLPSESVTLKITGKLHNKGLFEGNDVIRVIRPP